MEMKSETARIDDFVERGNYHAAINLALSAMNECRRADDQHGVDHFLGVIRSISDELAQRFGSKE